ncbi:DUF2569 family protein [Sphingomonas sp.]|uniref:DUF2569 family protein n=1 Tax=Sphingomonas sp. TaxID=28214 RepID=UPI0025F27319|nr:DUF2569 family protein [Sphingomonas sp.]MBV9527432.1 DUF2569 family protein [Sphingomonas sp.]
MLERYGDRLQARSAALLVSLDSRLDRILQYWLLVAGLVAAARVTFSAHPAGGPPISTIASYALVVVAPFVATMLALRWFHNGDRQPQPVTRLARIGRWRTIYAAEARLDPLYGTTGMMVSLLVGIMLNVPVRTAEYLAAMPPIPSAAPSWLAALHFAMTFDVVAFGSLYMIAFVAALRRVPLFPRLMVAIWMADLAMQVATAKLVVAAGPLPESVAVALQNMLTGNVKKVLISMALWLPYLLLSRRVNVTFRHRVPA